MRKLCVALSAVVLAAIFWVGAGPVWSQVPKDFKYEETKPMGPVTFSHKIHVTDKKLQCPDCHTKIFEMKKVAAPKMTMKVLNEGEFCGKCHNGGKAFSTKEAKDCSKCHAKK
ncbi:MAG: cytochrome C [Deltaproteobacteria bacterium]|nr:cytochrome C [Deltaproteobacteria bacterium]